MTGKDAPLRHADGQPMTVHGTVVTIRMAVEALGDRCALCQGGPLVTVGIFLPHDAARFVARTVEAGFQPPREESERRLLYGLCRSCHALPDKADRVEAKLEEDRLL
jgi:hypothetical protein